MATADGILASLNAALARAGEDVVVARPAAPTTPGTYMATAHCRALIRPASSGVGNIKLILSPTDLINAGWATQTGDTVGDVNVPRGTDKVVVQSRRRDIKASVPIYFDGTLIRIELEATS